MANASAILRGLTAAKARSQATTPSGTVSPLVAQYEQWTSGRVSSPLPRPAEAFLNGSFGPLTPMRPAPVDAPRDGEDQAEPRRWEYPVGWNLPTGSPGSEGLKLASFESLRLYADMYSVARQCIRLRKDELAGLRWDIQMTPEAMMAARGDKKAHQDFQERRRKAIKFFRKPDPNYSDFSSWLSAAMEDVFVLDALAIYLHPARGRGAGLLGSDLAALDLIAGETIRPLVDLRGSTPAAPSVAYQQYLWGVPRTDLMAIASGGDVDGMDDGLVGQYRGDQLLYLRTTPRTWTPYGFSAVEGVVLPTVTGILRQRYAYDFFQEGSIPGMFVSPGDTSLTAQQIRELQDALNAVAGDPAWKHKIVVLPGGSKADPMKPISLADAYDDVVMSQTSMGFDVRLEELGIMQGARAGAAAPKPSTGSVIERRPSLRSLLLWLKANIFDRVLVDICGQDDMRWTWEGLDTDPGADQIASVKDQVMIGLASIDEARQELGRTPWGLPMTSDPGILTATGFVPLGSIDPETGKPLDDQPPAPGQAGAPGESPAVGNAPAGPGKPAGPAAPLPPSTGADSSSRGGTPAHAGAQALAPAGKAPQKAAVAELAALRRHLNKGRAPATWDARYLPADLVRSVAVDVARGLTVDEAVDAATELLVKGGPDPKGPSWPGWEVDEALAAHYAPLIAAAIAGAADAVELASGWLASHPAKASGNGGAAGWLSGRGIAARIVKALTRVLRGLWTESWYVGHRSATAILQGGPVDWGTWTPGDVAAAELVDAAGLHDLLDRYGIDTIHAIADTRMGELADALQLAVEDGTSAEELARRIRPILDAPDRALMVAGTETARASQQSALATYTDDGVSEVDWNAVAGACDVCRANAELGPVPIGHLFAHKPGTSDAPPAHPECRCALMPAAIGPVRLAAHVDKIFDEAEHPRDVLGQFMAAVEGVRERHPHVQVDVSAHHATGHATLSLIRSRETGHGHADAALGDLVEQADRHGVTVSLTPEPLAGDRKTKKARLTAWYARHGFVPNRGRNRDYEISDSMYRSPKTGKAVAAPDLVKVGPHGYIHGWIYVGAPGAGGRVLHPSLGHGTVAEHNGHQVTIDFDRGHRQTFEARHQPVASSPAEEHFERRSVLAMSDDELVDDMSKALEDGDDQRVDEIVREMDTRDATGVTGGDHDAWLTGGDASTIETREDTEQDRAVDALVAKGYSYVDAYAEVHEADAARMHREESAALVDRADGETAEKALRRQYDEWTHMNWIAAEQSTRGNLLSAAGRKAGIDPVELFSGPIQVARRNASEELQRWWAEHGRLNFADWRAMVLNRDAGRQLATAGARSNGKDFI